MKKIICYGDSNTYGFNPKNGLRFDENTRWTSLLQKILGNEYDVLEEGANNRTGIVNNPDGFNYTSQRHFPKLLSKIKGADIIILAIGTNDLQFLFDISFKTFEKGIEALIQQARDSANRVILVPPVILSESVLKGYFKLQFDETSISKSKKIGRIYKKLAGIYKCEIFDFNDFVKPSDIDGLHYDESSHEIIAQKLAEFIRKENK